MAYKPPLFHYKAKSIGLSMIFLSLVFAYLYFWGGKPEFFNIKVPAIASMYLESRFFVVAQTNILDELAAILFIMGIAVFSFSEEKNEKEDYTKLRVKSLFYAIYTTIGIWILSFLLIYGLAIFAISATTFILFLVVYNIFFRYFLLKHDQKPFAISKS